MGRSVVVAILACAVATRAELLVTGFGQQLGNAHVALEQGVFSWAIRHRCVVRLSEDIEDDQLRVARGFGKYNRHAPASRALRGHLSIGALACRRAGFQRRPGGADRQATV